MNVTYTLSEENIEELHRLYQKEWWTKGRTLQETKKVVAGSQINIGILDAQNILIGYARVLTDFTFKAIIFDVIVSEFHRDKGLGKRIMQLIKNHKRLASVKSYELYCLPEMFAFYESLGFSTDVAGIKLMRCANA
ncbi:GNAT family N-acetyltransferase [Pseudoalteromonas phenolica]|uniref:GNAT family N-acetyltransferase n=1 Tax=Pseudoalteromonas phenolica TaxID=161398 RepID=A0A4Q7IJ55_9GAMM|nr:GNAT family N-acetyltransferase [Pseudoalteromonas phenolica]RZQ51226.1 GNAT family N-acetyltransferase [Pseudoalteromonas phenolica]